MHVCPRRKKAPRNDIVFIAEESRCLHGLVSVVPRHLEVELTSFWL